MKKIEKKMHKKPKMKQRWIEECWEKIIDLGETNLFI